MTIKKQIKAMLSEANAFNGNITGTAINKLPKKLKELLVDELHWGVSDLEKLFYDKHLKQLIIQLKNDVKLDKNKLEKIFTNEDFIRLSNIDGNIGITFRYKPITINSKSKGKIVTDENILDNFYTEEELKNLA